MNIINAIEAFFTPEPSYKVVSVTFIRMVPSFYGLCGFKREVLTMTSPCEILDWELGIYKPEGYTYYCTNYELESK